MKRIMLICSLLFINVGYVFSQATDFITNDCNGVSHHLFDELDNGNVVVIAWVMPCGPCATYSLPAYSAVQSFITSHPGQVHFYMADDYANTACSSLSSWGNNYNMTNSTYFSSSSVNMNGYGLAGMPKVVVLGGLDHHIYFNENDTKINFSDVQIAIDSALNNFVASTKELESIFRLNIFPNPTQEKLTINYHLNKNEKITFKIVDLLGKEVKSFVVFNDSGNNTIDLDISKLPSETYILQLHTSKATESLRFTISK